MSQKASRMSHPMKIEFTREYLLVWLANDYTTRSALIYKDFCLDVAQCRLNGALNETRTHP